MTTELITILPDGAFVITAHETSDESSWKLEYTATPDKVQAILDRARPGMRVQPAHASRFVAFIEAAKKIKQRTTPDFEYSGPNVAMLHTAIALGLRRHGTAMLFDTEKVPMNCFSAYYTESKPVMGFAVWAVAHTEAHVAFFHTRTQMKKLMHEVANAIRADLRIDRTQFELVPEHSPKQAARFSGEAAQLVCSCLVYADIARRRPH